MGPDSLRKSQEIKVKPGYSIKVPEECPETAFEGSARLSMTDPTFPFPYVVCTAENCPVIGNGGWCRYAHGSFATRVKE